MIFARPQIPQDPRFKALERTMKKLGYDKSSLIESLHAAQEAFGFLDDEAMKFVAASLRLPLSKVYGVATFYHYFTLKPAGEHTCVVCTGTACYIKGSGKIVDSVCKKHKIKAGETTKDGKLSLITARCIGCCGIAPAVVIDGEVMGTMDEEKTMNKLEGLLK
jgi:bidirectional [NiFe] hydrogenase diaphorase subunit